MGWVLRIYSGENLTETDIGDKKQTGAGGDARDDLRIPGLAPHALNLKLTGKGWRYQTKTPLADGTKTGAAEEETIYAAEDRSFAFVLYQTDRIRTGRFSLDGEEKFLVGRKDDCRIIFDSRLVSRHHAVFQRNGIGWEITDCSGSGETYVNGRKTKEAQLAQGDVIDMGLCRMIFTENALELRYLGQVKLVPLKTEDNHPYEEGKGYPLCYRRSPRLMQKIEQEERELPAAPAREAAPRLDWLSVFLRPAVSIGLMAAMVALFALSPVTLIFSGPMTIVGVILTVVSYRSRKKGHKQGLHVREERYGEYLEQLEKTIAEKQNLQRDVLLRSNPSFEDCISMVKRRDRRLWERRREDGDFGAFRLGIGDIPSCIVVKPLREQPFADRDALDLKGQEMISHYEKNKDCPVLLDLVRCGNCGFAGPRQVVVPLVRSLISQAAFNHSYDELKIILICRKEEWDQWQPVRWFPHVFDDTRTSRYLADSREEAEELLASLTDTVRQRFRNHDGAASSGSQDILPELPYLLFVCADYEIMRDQPIMDYLTRQEPGAGVGALFLFNRIDLLPIQCPVIVEADERKGRLYDKRDVSSMQRFVPDQVTVAEFDRLARAMAPIRLEGGVSQELPVSVSFLQGYGVGSPKEIDLETNWSNARPEVSLAVPVGVRAGGRPFYFDIHEKKHGTQGVVAGMTGSGKTEMVQTWILSMAVHFPPEAVSFVLIDFKGTGLILPFQNLPHLAGTISDLDTGINRNLIALENELNRREQMLSENGVKNINEYLRLYREKKVSEPLSILTIVIDEFAEFKVRYPDYMDKVNSIFARGRALGVFIMLLTQKPAGVVGDKMSGNSKFFWCLKVASSEDSRDVLRRPDAARITNPGRAYIRVGEDEVYEQIQSYYSGAPYIPGLGKGQKKAGKLYAVDIQGHRERVEAEATTGYRSEKNEIDAVVEYIDSYVREHGLARARNVWTKKLDSVICLNQILSIAFDGEKWNQEEDKCRVIVGMIDDPRSQSQYPLQLNFSDQGNAVVYGTPGTGKTVLLQTAVFSLALSYSPDAVQMYILDFGGGNLAVFGNLPHVGEVVLRDEEEKLEKTIQILREELNRRKRLFAASGAMNVPAYRQMTGQKLPYCMLILDNAAQAFGISGPLQDFVLEYSREGTTYGMYVMVTAVNQGGLSYRMADHFRMALALRMNDASDYAAIVGRTGGLIPEDLPGRGLVKGTPPLEFQAALPVEGETDSERFSTLRSLILLMKEKWKGDLPQSARLMPERVEPAMVSGPGAGIGLSFADLERVAVEPEKEAFLVISAEEHTGKRLMRTIIGQCEKMDHDRLIVFGGERESERMTILSRGDEFDRYLDGLLSEIQVRKDQKKENPGLRFKPIIIGIPVWKEWYGAVSDETKDRMSAIVSLGAPLGVMVLAAGTPDWISRLYRGKDSMLMGMIQTGLYLIAGGKVGDHCLLDVRVSFRQQGEPIEKDEACLMKNGQCIRIRTVSDQEG